MHCSCIRLSLYHYEDESGKLQVNAQIKNLLKARGFKWKTVTNEAHSGSRVEILECPNIALKEQTNPLKCTVFRRGLTREDVHKEPFTVKISTFLALGDQKGEAPLPEAHLGSVQSVFGVFNAIM